MKLIKNGTIISNHIKMHGDILIENKKIIEVAPNIEADNAEIYDATGCIVMPGFIDSHTHFEMDQGQYATADTFATGTKAALVNGTTTIIDFATQDKQGSLQTAYESWLKKAQGQSSCHYRFHMAITDWNKHVKAEMVAMVKQGVTSFKLYMAYDSLMLNDAQIQDCLTTVKQLNGLLGVHCENGTLIDYLQLQELSKGNVTPSAIPRSRPPSVEAEAINRLAYISELVDYPVMIVHLTSEAGLREVRAARDRQVKLYVETCPQYLFLDESKYSELEGAKYVLAPPLRTKKDNEAIIQALIDDEIQTIGTDHCSFNYEKQKSLNRADFTKIPNGLPGVEHRPLLIYSYLVKNNLITIEKMVDFLATNPAKLYDLYPNKGIIRVGSDADIIVFNPASKQIISAKNQLQNVDYTPYEGFEVFGKSQYVFLNGVEVVRDGQVIKENQGIYAKREEEK